MMLPYHRENTPEAFLLEKMCLMGVLGPNVCSMPKTGALRLPGHQGHPNPSIRHLWAIHSVIIGV